MLWSKNHFSILPALLSSLKENDSIEIKSFSKFLETNPNYKLLIAGEGEERKNLTNFIKKNSLEEKIILLGHIDNR